jgi:hypothetical protein
MPCHPDRVRLHYLVEDLDRVQRQWRAEVTAEHLPYAISRDPQVKAALEAGRLAWGVTANVIEGETHDDRWGV